MKPSQEYIDAFQEVADLTAPKCAGCRAPFACCSKGQCEDTKAFALEHFGISLEETGGALPFLGDSGCVVPPHLRPLCAVHVCEMHLENPEFLETYMAARDRADEVLWNLLVPSEDE